MSGMINTNNIKTPEDLEAALNNAVAKNAPIAKPGARWLFVRLLGCAIYGIGVWVMLFGERMKMASYDRTRK